MFELKNVSKIYSQGEQSLTALSDISISFDKNGFVSIVGESGCGKTTLLNMLAGFDELNEGEITFEDKIMDIHDEECMSEYYRQDVGFVFQEYNVIEDLSVWDNIQLSLEMSDIAEQTKNAQINESLAKVGLLGEKDKKVSKLSGGQKQRVAIARAYVKKPKVILADEPTGNLDYNNSVNIFKMLKDISKDVLVIVVTHDKNMARTYSDRIVNLFDGRIIDDRKLSTGEFLLKISDGSNEEEIEDYSSIVNFIKTNQNNSGEYILKVDKANCTEEKVNKTTKNIIRYMRKKVSVKKLYQLSGQILCKRKFRQCLSVAIFIITISLLLTLFNLAFYDEDKVVTNYLEKYEEKEVLVKKKIDNVLESETGANYAYMSKEIKQYLINMANVETFYQFNDIVFRNSEDMIERLEEKENVNDKEEKTFFEVVSARIVTECYLKEQYEIEKLDKNEIVITEKLAEECKLTEDDIGKSFYVNENEVVLQHIVKGEKTMMYLSEGYMEYAIEKNNNTSITVNGNFLNSKSLFEYANSGMMLCNVEESKNEELIEKIDEKGAGVILSRSFINEYMGDIDTSEVIGEKMYLIDLYQEKYGNAFSEKMNLYDYFGDEIIVVGVADFDGDVYVNDEIFQNILDDYYDIYVYDAMGCYTDDWGESIAELHREGFLVEDENLNDVYTITEFKPIIMKYVTLILSVMILLTFFLMITIISYSIKDNSKLIGILKSLGIRNKEIKKMFSIQPTKIIMTSFVVACVIVFLLVRYVNIEYCENVYGRGYNILPYNYFAIVVAFFLTCIIGMFTVLCPLKGMDRKTIIENVKY